MSIADDSAYLIIFRQTTSDQRLLTFRSLAGDAVDCLRIVRFNPAQREDVAHIPSPTIRILRFRRRLLRLPSQKRIGRWLLQQFAAFARDLAHVFRLVVIDRQRPIHPHGAAPFALQAGARIVSQPPTPTDKALAGDALQTIGKGFCSIMNLGTIVGDVEVAEDPRGASSEKELIRGHYQMM